MLVSLEVHCSNCFRVRDVYSIQFPTPRPPPFRGQRRQGAAGPSKATAGLGRSAGKVDVSSARPTSEGVSRKSGSPTDSRHDVTPEETSISLLKRSKHAHRPSEPEFPLGLSFDDEAQNNRELDKSAITADEISVSENIYDVLRDISEDIEVSGPSSDAESDLDSLRGTLLEPETGYRSSDNPEASERSRAKLKRGLLVPPVIYMLLVRVCGIVTRLFEPNPLPGKTRIRWRCVSYSRYVLLIHKCFFI